MSAETSPLSAAATHARSYRTHAGLPSLAGLASFPQAVEPGLSVEESVRRLKVHHYAWKRVHQVLLARLTSEPVYELKMAFSLHAHIAAEHVAAIRARVGEMREPPLGLDRVPHTGLELLFDEIRQAPTTAEFLIGLYELAHRPEVPTAVIIDEAVKLAKRFSTDDSGKFVNGMLSNIVPLLRG